MSKSSRTEPFDENNTIKDFMDSITGEIPENVSLKWYLSGPMSGYKNYNFATFEKVTRFFRQYGFNIVSPHECEPEPEGTPENIKWERMMAKCFEQMETCNGIILLPGWPESRGAMQELKYAVEHQWIVFFFQESTKKLIRMSRKETFQ